MKKRRPFSCTGVRVLVVDDEEMNLVVAKGVLGSYGIQVDTCLSGREAVERCKSMSYNIIFLDHMMPGFDGVETLRHIREMDNGLFQDLPAIALTANTISGAREMFRNEGFTEFIPKPIERAILERVLRKVLPKRCIQYHSSADLKSEKFEYTAPAAPALNESVPETDSSFSLDDLTQVGINVKLGLDYCSDEEEFYLEMLQMFLEQYTQKRDEINSLYEAANWKDYAIKVHALKSTSLTIGAEQLSDCAKMLEQAGKKEDAEYIRENHANLLELYEKVCTGIERL